MDRIPIATKGGKTAAGKDQIIHYTQQHGGKVISYIIQHPKFALFVSYLVHSVYEVLDTVL